MTARPTTEIDRAKGGYWNSEPVSPINPGGMDESADGTIAGHVDNFPAAVHAVGLMTQWAGEQVEAAGTLTAAVTAAQTDVQTRQADVAAKHGAVVADAAQVATDRAAVAADKTAVHADRLAADADAVATAADRAAVATYVTTMGAALVATSATNNVAIGTGAKTLTVETGKGFAAGMYLVATDAANAASTMTGQVSSYTPGTGALVLSVPSGGTTGSGTPSSWTVGISGSPGGKGDTGPITTYWGGTAGGTANALTATTGASLSALTAGMIVGVKIGASANGSTATLAVDSVPAIAIRKNGSALGGGELSASTDAWFQYDGTYWRLLGGSSSGGIFRDVVTITGATTLDASHAGKHLVLTGTFTLALTAAATLGKGWSFSYRVAAGTVLIDPAGSETIQGGTTLTAVAGDQGIVGCDGALFDGITIRASSTASTCTMNPSDKASAITLSNGNLSITGANVAGVILGRATRPLGSGWYYCEYVPTANTGDCYGIANVLAALGVVGNIDVNAAFYYSSTGQRYTNGGLSTLGSSWGPGNIMGLFINADMGAFGVAKDGVAQGGFNPTTFANPVLTGLAGPLYVAWCDANGSDIPSGTFRFTSTSWTYSPPAAYRQIP